MIEINLYSVPKEDVNARVGRCIARNRFDREAMGVSVEQFVKGFLKDNLDRFEAAFGNTELTNIINSDSTLSRKDLTSINYFLGQEGYRVQIQNVADDEENATGVPSGEVIEWNVIDRNFVQFEYPTATKIIPGDKDIIEVLEQIVNQSGLFNDDKFSGMRNPFTSLIDGLKRIKNISGSINGSIVSRIYEYLDQCGIEVFCATSED